MAKKTVKLETEPANQSTGFVITGTFYDRLQLLIRVLLPAASALYFGLGQIWGFPEIEKVVGSLAVLMTVGGGLLQVSTSNYKKNDVGVDAYIPADSPLLEDFAGQDKVTFKVDPSLQK